MLQPDLLTSYDTGCHTAHAKHVSRAFLYYHASMFCYRVEYLPLPLPSDNRSCIDFRFKSLDSTINIKIMICEHDVDLVPCACQGGGARLCLISTR